MLSIQDVEKIAKLARIKLSAAEIKKFQKDLGDVLNYVSKLEEFDTKEIKPLFNAAPHYNILRDDERGEEDDQEAERILKEAPDRKGRLFRGKNIF